MKRFVKFLAMGMALLLCVAVLCTPASAATVRVYDKDIFLSDDESTGSGWRAIANDPGFYFDTAGVPVHRSPSLWTATDKADKAFSWKYDTVDKKEGNSCLSQTYSTGFFFYWMAEFAGETLDLTNTQYVLMDLYVEDPEIFLKANDFRIDFTDSTDKNNLHWDGGNVSVSRDTLKGMFLRKGWNSLRLYLANTDETATIDLTKVTGLRFFAEGLSGETTHTIKLDNVHIVSKGYTTQEANVTTTTTKASTTTTKKPVADATTTASVATTTAEQPAETTASTVQTTTASDATEGTTVSVEDTVGTTTAPAVVESEVEAETQTGTESSDATTVTDPKPDGGIPAWVWIVVGVAVVAIAAVVIVVARKKK